nr:hypothetical protein [Terrabacter sp. MAHUQ-38]
MAFIPDLAVAAFATDFAAGFAAGVEVRLVAPAFAGVAFFAAVVLLAVDRLAAVLAAAVVFFAAIRSSVAHAVDADKWG